MWSEKSATTASVTDSAGNSYVELLHFTASDKTEMSIWAAPISAGGGTKPTITVKPSSQGRRRRRGARILGRGERPGSDRRSTAPPSTQARPRRPATVSSGATQPTTGADDLAIGFYLDSGFGDKLAGGSGYTTRANVSPEENIELLAQDAVVPAGSTPNPTFGTGAATTGSPRPSPCKGANPGPSPRPARRPKSTPPPATPAPTSAGGRPPTATARSPATRSPPTSARSHRRRPRSTARRRPRARRSPA